MNGMTSGAYEISQFIKNGITFSFHTLLAGIPAGNDLQTILSRVLSYLEIKHRMV